MGDALAGDRRASEALDRVEPPLRTILYELVDRLEGIDEPQAFAAALAE